MHAILVLTANLCHGCFAEDSGTGSAAGADTFLRPEFNFDFGPVAEFIFTPPPDLGPVGEDVLPPDDTTPTEDLACAPDCGERTCGDDGCGGSCGVCEDPAVCEAGACQRPGETCASPLILPVGAGAATLADTLASRQDDLSCEAGGESAGAGSEEVVVRLVPSVTDRVLVTVEPAGAATVLALSACESGAACEVAKAGALIVSATAGSPIDLAIEAAGEAPGAFTLRVRHCDSLCVPGSCAPNACGEPCPCGAGTLCIGGACGPVAPGDTCAAATTFTTLPLLKTVDLAAHTDAVSCAGGPEGVDAIFKTTPGVDQRVRVSVASAGPVAAYVTETCGVSTDACKSVATPEKSLGATLPEGRPSFIVLEGPQNAQAAVSIEKCQGCDSACPCLVGDLCQSGNCVSPAGGDTCSSRSAS